MDVPGLDRRPVADALVVPDADRSADLAASDHDCLSAMVPDCPLASGEEVGPGELELPALQPQDAQLPVGRVDPVSVALVVGVSDRLGPVLVAQGAMVGQAAARGAKQVSSLQAR
jgi:hypothetical protein